MCLYVYHSQLRRCNAEAVSSVSRRAGAAPQREKEGGHSSTASWTARTPPPSLFCHLHNKTLCFVNTLIPGLLPPSCFCTLHTTCTSSLIPRPCGRPGNEASAVDATKLGRSLRENKATHHCSEESALANHLKSHLNYNLHKHRYVSTRTIAKIHAFMEAKKRLFRIPTECKDKHTVHLSTLGFIWFHPCL